MRFRIIAQVICMFVVAFLAIPTRVPAQAETKGHHHYKLFDLGTFGGPAAPGNGFNGDGPSSPQMNQRGMSVGAMDTATPDPNAPNMCFFDCWVDISFLWNNGIVTPLQSLPGGVDLSSYAFGINIFSQIVGQAQNGATDPLTGWPELRAVLWDRGQIADLGTLGGNESSAQSINDFGQVVGGALTITPDPFANELLNAGSAAPSGAFVPCQGLTFAFCSLAVPGATETRAFIWQNGFMRDLGTLGGPDSTAWINNDRGEVAGWSFTSFVANASSGVPTVDPFFWSPRDGKMTDLGGLGGTYGYTTWLNNQGQVVGASNVLGDQTQHPYIWSKSQGMVDLFLNGGLGGNFGYPDWVNDAGEVVGFATIPGDQDGHAFLWRNGEMTDLGTIGTDPDSEAHSINSEGQIVGASLSLAQDKNLHGFLWENGGPIVDLNTLVLPGTGTHVVTGQFINDRGEIACTGKTVAIPIGHPCMLIPCDENHPGIEGCDYSLVDAATAAEVLPAHADHAPAAAATQNQLSAEMMVRYRSLLLSNRHRRSGVLDQ